MTRDEHLAAAEQFLTDADRAASVGLWSQAAAQYAAATAHYAAAGAAGQAINVHVQQRHRGVPDIRAQVNRD